MTLDRLDSSRENIRTDNNKVVVNLSSHQLSDVATKVLAKGNNFSIAPTRIPTEEIINQVEASIRILPATEAEEIRSETCRILRKVKKLKSNITVTERKELKRLKDNKDILILSADKGNATVVMDTKD